MKKMIVLPLLTRGLCAALAVFLHGELDAGQPTNKYETGSPALARITRELCHALEASHIQGFQPSPVILEKVSRPWIQPGEFSTGSGTLHAVTVSPAFIDLVNYVSHAKAVDDSQPGFLKRSFANLATAGNEKATALFPAIAGEDSWSFDTMNTQVSYFNQIAGGLIAVDLAHHYLGHYQKYASQLGNGQGTGVPINTVVTPQEWREAVLKGARNALDCGYGTEGLKTIFDAVARMPNRPEWADDILPPKANVAKISRELDQLEKKFFITGNR